MKIELQRLYDAGLMERLDYLEADTVLRREHKQELEFLKKSEVEWWEISLFGWLF